ncbi:MAG: hypothetical protein NT003_00610 [Candidatus Magasanikbacteria bacterium]|nr:hypothetical protein [Candidatus Magasanikbacteria bacterium]
MQLLEIDELFKSSWLVYKPRAIRLALITFLASAVAAIVTGFLIGLTVFIGRTPIIHVGGWILQFFKLTLVSIPTRPSMHDFILCGIIALFCLIYLLIVGTWFSATLWHAVLQPTNIDIGDAFEEGFKSIPRLLGVTVLVNTMIAIGSLFLIVPGILLSGWFVFAPIAAIKGNPIIKSIKYSRALVLGRWWAIVGRLILAGIIAVVLPRMIAQAPQSISSHPNATLVLLLAGIIPFLQALFLSPWYMIFKRMLYENAEQNMLTNFSTPVAPTLTLE